MKLLVLVGMIPGLWVSAAMAAGDSEVEPPDPWVVLGELRENLASEAMQAEFVQTFLPAGFSSGDRETGRLYVSLPACVRWDYREPDAKVFLLCESTIYTWNPGEPAGRRFDLTDSEEPGIDLLRLQLDDLGERYEASLLSATDGGLEVLLSPIDPESTLVEARITTDSEHRRLTALAYRDREGNVSRFEIGHYEPLEGEELFAPPVDLEWLDR